MIINVKVVANAKQNKVNPAREQSSVAVLSNGVKEEENRYKVYLTASPVEGKANKLLIEILADYFKVKKDKVRILRGTLLSNKTVEIGSEK